MPQLLAGVPAGWNVHTGRNRPNYEALRRADALPNFFLVGAMKAGTTAIYEVLRSHPEVYCSPIKEPNFFCDDIVPETFSDVFKPSHSFDANSYVDGPMDRFVHIAYIRDSSLYARMFRNVCRERVVGDFSTSYLYSSTAAANIRGSVANPRVLIVLRNPVERAVSHYLMDSRIGIATGPLGDLLEKELSAPHRGWCVTNQYIELGLYSQQVKRYLMNFPRQRIKIVIYDDLRNDFQGTTDEICNFLGIEPLRRGLDDVRRNTAKCSRFPEFNRWLYRSGLKNAVSRYVPKNVVGWGKKYYYGRTVRTKVSLAEREWLRVIFRDDIQELSRLLHRDLSGWVTEPYELPRRNMRSVA